MIIAIRSELFQQRRRSIVLVAGAFCVVSAEEFGAEIVAGRMPDQVGVVGVVLRVVVFNSEGRAVDAEVMDAEVMAIAALEAGRPGKVQIVEPACGMRQSSPSPA